MIIDSKFIIEELCKAFKLASVTTIPWNGDEIDYKNIENRLSNSLVTMFSGFRMNRNNSLYRADGYFLAGTLIPFCYSKTAKSCIQLMQSFILLGLNSDMTEKFDIPFDIGGIDFYRWNPLDMAGQAEQLETFYFMENRIEIIFTLGG